MRLARRSDWPAQPDHPTGPTHLRYRADAASDLSETSLDQLLDWRPHETEIRAILDDRRIVSVTLSPEKARRPVTIS